VGGSAGLITASAMDSQVESAERKARIG
jgi:hypothetical protein